MAIVFLSYISSCKLGLAIPKGWIPQTPLGWNQENASWDLHIEMVLLLSIGDDRAMKIEVFHTSMAHCTLNGFYQ